MRRGNSPQLIFSNSGQLVAFCTGADATAEHECGSARLQEALCGAPYDEQALLEQLRRKEPVVYPSLVQRKLITRTERSSGGEGLQFIEVPSSADQPAQAILGYARHHLMHFKDELRFPSSTGGLSDDIDVAGAWDDESFAIRVRGDKKVKELKRFYEAMLAGDCLFAGTFFKAPAKYRNLSGVLIARQSLLNQESVEAISEAQAEFESKMRLKAIDDIAALRQEMRAAAKVGGAYQDPGYLWMAWANKEETHAVYCLNPGYRVKADYFGPYTRQELLDWAATNFSYELKPKAEKRVKRAA